MKRIVFTLGLCLVTALSFGQKKAVADALKLAKNSRPNFTEARSKIKDALQHPETKDDAKTWFTAGQIENLQFDNENIKQYQQLQPNEVVMYTALYQIYPYFSKAYELDIRPDAKGKVKPKFAKDMKAITRINLPYLMNGGIFYYEQQDFQKAYEFFDQYVVITDSHLMTDGEPANTLAAADSNYIYSNFYAAIAASTLDKETAIKAMTRASAIDYRRNEMLQYLAEAYNIAEDNANYEKTLAEGLALFPTEPYFLFNLIMIYIESERNDKALEYVLMAVKLDPDNAQLCYLAGQVYEVGFNDFVKAEEYFIKSLELDSEDAMTQFNLGRIYYNRGVEQLDVANEIADVKKYNEEKDKAKDFFRKSLPYLEKAFELNPESMETIIPLRNIYYNLDMGDKLEKIEKLLGE